MDKIKKYKLKKVKNPAISLWKEEERKRKLRGQTTRMEVIPRKIILSFN